MKEKIRVPSQERAQRTKHNIVLAAIHLFSEKGYHNTSSNEISEKAGISIGSFYSYFKNKKHLFLEAMDFNYTVITKQAQDDLAIHSDDKKEILMNYICRINEQHQVYRDFHREIMAMCLLDEDIRKKASEQERFEIERIKKLLYSLKDDIQVENLDAASTLVYYASEKIIHLSMFSQPEVKQEELMTELADMIIKYLF